jgi:acyl-CoA dehydrogenase
MLSQIAILEQFYYTAVPFPFANVPNILYECQGDQIEKFLKPVVEGRMTTCFAQTEPNAGSDPGGMMQTRAVQKGRNWVLNGTKMWISMAAESDLMLVQAVTDPDQRQRGGITMFLVERNNPGVHIEQPGRRHSAPASMKTRSRPSASASRRTASDPGTTTLTGRDATDTISNTR